MLSQIYHGEHTTAYIYILHQMYNGRYMTAMHYLWYSIFDSQTKLLTNIHDLPKPLSWISTPALRQKLRIGQPYTVAYNQPCRMGLGPIFKARDPIICIYIWPCPFGCLSQNG